MICPLCNKPRQKKDWSPHQWRQESPSVIVNGWRRNCCKHCSQEVGWYFKDQPPGAAETGTAATAASAQEASARAAGKPCSPEADWASPSPSPPPAATTFRPQPPSPDELRRVAEGAQHWLRANIHPSFWVQFHDWVDQQNLTYRANIAAVNASMHLKENTSLMKHLSYKGAARMSAWCPDDWVSWRCPAGQRYTDLGNET